MNNRFNETINKHILEKCSCSRPILNNTYKPKKQSEMLVPKDQSFCPGLLELGWLGLFWPYLFPTSAWHLWTEQKSKERRIHFLDR